MLVAPSNHAAIDVPNCAGISELPPVVQPELLRDARLIGVMPNWHLGIFHLWIVHLGNCCHTCPVRVFKEFAAQMVPTLFLTLPT